MDLIYELIAVFQITIFPVVLASSIYFLYKTATHRCECGYSPIGPERQKSVPEGKRRPVAHDDADLYWMEINKKGNPIS